jgi:energy-coupling factor transporter ATP-binding protein EcfA2
LAYGRLEDITFTSLAPALRRCGYYLVHAFGAVRDGRCVLLIGPSGSGKTTTGLSLILEGWQLLANDTLLIEAREDGIYALSTPGGLTVRPQTLTLLPACRPLLGDAPLLHGGYTLTNQQLADPTTTAARITAVYFCQIEDREQSVRRPLSQAVALARLMEQSVDRWDEAMLTQHIAVLHQLSQQTAAYTLHLGRDVPRLPHLFAA